MMSAQDSRQTDTLVRQYNVIHVASPGVSFVSLY